MTAPAPTLIVVLDDYFYELMTYTERRERMVMYSCITCAAMVGERTGKERRHHYDFHVKEKHTIYLRKS